MSPLHGINTYISKPTKSNGVANGKIDRMILISDVFGVYPNAKLLADEWAGQGYEVLAPEFVDPIPTDMLNVSVLWSLLWTQTWGGWKLDVDCAA